MLLKDTREENCKAVKPDNLLNCEEAMAVRINCSIKNYNGRIKNECWAINRNNKREEE